MGNKLREVFNNSEEQAREFKNMCEELTRKALEHRKGIKLVKEGNLYSVEGYRLLAFIGDCSFCSHAGREDGKSEGVWCEKHGWACGWGFTCPDNDSEYNNDWDEFQRIKAGG